MRGESWLGFYARSRRDSKRNLDVERTADGNRADSVHFPKKSSSSTIDD